MRDFKSQRLLAVFLEVSAEQVLPASKTRTHLHTYTHTHTRTPSRTYTPLSPRFTDTLAGLVVGKHIAEREGFKLGILEALPLACQCSVASHTHLPWRFARWSGIIAMSDSLAGSMTGGLELRSLDSGQLAIHLWSGQFLNILWRWPSWWRGSMPGVSPEGKMGWAAAHDTTEPLYFGVSDYPRLSNIAQRHHTIQDPCPSLASDPHPPSLSTRPNLLAQLRIAAAVALC